MNLVSRLNKSQLKRMIFSFDSVWKAMNDQIHSSSSPTTVSVARCYVVKNRQQDVVPYDWNR